MEIIYEIILNRDELASAIQNRDLQKASQLLSIMDIENINRTFIPSFYYDDSSIGEITRYLTLIQFVIKEGSLDLLEILLAIEGIEINTVRDYIPPLFIAIELNRSEMLSLLLKHPKININNVFNCFYSKNCTPLMYALYLNKPHMFYQLLQFASINTHLFIESACHIFEFLKIYDGENKMDFVTPLMDHYCDLFIYQPDVIRDILDRNPKLINFLANYRSELWRSLNKRVYTLEAQQYYLILKDIVDSECREKSAQNPFYIVFAFKKESSWFSMFYDAPLDELKKIKEKVKLITENDSNFMMTGLVRHK